MTRNLNLDNITYIYELPYAVHKEFCNIMDMNDNWEELGGYYMKMNNATLYKLRQAPMRYRSSTDELLTTWGQQNHTILELFIILHKMQHHRAMIILKPFVDYKYHKLITQGNTRFSNLIKSESGNNSNVTLNTDNNERRVNNLERENLNKIVKKNMQNYLDPSVISVMSSTEASIPLITYNELEKATNYWNNENILGKGGFGVVFKGIWKSTAVAIKRLEVKKGAEQQFNILEAQRQQLFIELKYLNSCRHDNILPLYGFSIGGEKPCLVYQFMNNGSLEDRLQCRHGTKPLPWYIRFQIATGSAKGLQFLHGMDTPLIHGDIKSANILLDPHFEPRIGDFGLSREGPIQEYTHVKVSHVIGTLPYLPDEFLRSKKLSTKVDTYSFGVVLFEIATGEKAYDKSRYYEYLKDHVQKNVVVADVKAGPVENNLFVNFMTIGKNCISNNAKDRPEMELVFRELDGIMLQEKHQFEEKKKLPTPSGSYNPQPRSARKNSITGENEDELPLLSQLQIKNSNGDSKFQTVKNSHVPSNQLLKQNTSPVPHCEALTNALDRIESAVMPQIDNNNCSLKVTSYPASTISTNASPSRSHSDSHLTNNSNGDSNSTPRFVDSKHETSINSAQNNSITGENEDELPLITKLLLQPNIKTRCNK